jgi:hypothetical protein
VCGILYMVSQLTDKKESLLALNTVSTNLADDDDDDDDDQGGEHYEDIKPEVCGGLFSGHYSWCVQWMLHPKHKKWRGANQLTSSIVAVHKCMLEICVTQCSI